MPQWYICDLFNPYKKDSNAMGLMITMWIKFLILFAPFFVVSMFISMTQGQSRAERRSVANRAVFAATVTSLVLYFFGTPLFDLLGITLDSFRVGAGALLFLSAVSLVRDGTRTHAKVNQASIEEEREDVAVVPLAIPVIVGPASTGAILVYGAENHGWDQWWALFGMLLALVTILLCLRVANELEKILGKVGLNILSKLTGMVLAALAAQIVMSGINGFFGLNLPA